MSIFQREACHIFSTWTGHADTVNTLHFDGGLPLSELLDGPLLAREATVPFSVFISSHSSIIKS